MEDLLLFANIPFWGIMLLLFVITTLMSFSGESPFASDALERRIDSQAITACCWMLMLVLLPFVRLDGLSLVMGWWMTLMMTCVGFYLFLMAWQFVLCIIWIIVKMIQRIVFVVMWGIAKVKH